MTARAIDPTKPYLNLKWTTGMVDKVFQMSAQGAKVFQIAIHFDVTVKEMHEMMTRNRIKRRV